MSAEHHRDLRRAVAGSGCRPSCSYCTDRVLRLPGHRGRRTTSTCRPTSRSPTPA
ncbi:MAG: hypothetical protein MZV65_54295 [Chromatiales bacterium]|nr:hypothetical protein [Chromatiales bacterium]